MRRSLVLLGVAALAALAGAGSASPTPSACRATPQGGGGPFQANHAPAPRRARIGTGHVLTGRILRYPGCTPLRGAVVEFWQESPNGRYDRRGHGSVTTGPNGVFRFEGPVPPGEFGRPPHIHVHVSAAGYEDVVTTWRIARGARVGRLNITLVSSL